MSKTGKLGIYLTILQSLILVIGGILGYFLYDRILAIESIERTKSLKIETKINEIEYLLKPIREMVEIHKNTSQIDLNKAQIELALSESILRKIEADLLPTKEALQLVSTLAKAELVDLEKKIKSIDLELKRVKERLNQQEQKSRINLNVSDILNDIIPIIRCESRITRKSSSHVVVHCAMFNLGKHKCYVSAPTIEIRDRLNFQWKNDSSIRILKASGNTIPPGITGSMNFELISTSDSLVRGRELRFNVNATTDASIVSTTKKLLGSIVPDKHIDGLARQGYNINFVLLE